MPLGRFIRRLPASVGCVGAILGEQVLFPDSWRPPESGNGRGEFAPVVVVR